LKEKHKDLAKEVKPGGKTVDAGYLDSVEENERPGTERPGTRDRGRDETGDGIMGGCDKIRAAKKTGGMQAEVARGLKVLSSKVSR